MTIHKYVGENVGFEFEVLDSTGVAMDLSEATVKFSVRKLGTDEDEVNELDHTPTIALNVVSDSLTPTETITLGKGSYLWEFKVQVGTDVKKKQGKLVLHGSITD